MNVSHAAERLLSSSLEESLQVALELRERIEIVHSPEYGNFLAVLFPAFKTVLLEGAPASFSDCTAHKLRRVILDILNRMPNNETLRPYTAELMNVAHTVLGADNEENALTALRIIFDLHKNFRTVACSGPCGGASKADAVVKQTGQCILCWSCAKARASGSGTEMNGMVQVCLRDSVQPFLDTVRDLYRRLPQIVANFQATVSVAEEGAKEVAEGGAALAAGSSESTPSGSFIRGVDSFKVLTECPLIVMLLFQLYPEFISSVPAQSNGGASGNIPQLIPLMMQALQVTPPIADATMDLSIHGQIAEKSSSTVPPKSYKELVGCQVKTLSFLTYLLRGFAELMRPFEDAIAAAVVSLMRACPGDATAIRKELLVATRHILATEFRRGFFSHVDSFLNEELLVGALPSGSGGYSAPYEALRPLAYSTLADLVHHVRANLDLKRLAKVVHMYGKNIHSDTLPATIQTTSVRLLLNLTDYIFHNSEVEPGAGKVLLLRILKTLVGKFDTLRGYLAKVHEAENATQAEQQQLLTATSKQLEEVVKVRRAIMVEAQSCAQVVTCDPESELDKSLYGLVAMEALCEGTEPLFGTGEWATGLKQPLTPLPPLTGTVTDSSLVSFVRNVLRQNFGDTAVASSGNPVIQSLALGSQLYLGAGLITLTLNAASESGFPRQLCLRHVDLVSSQWHESTKVTLRVKMTQGSAASNASTEATKGQEWTELKLKSSGFEGCTFRLTLAEDVVCSALQVCIDTRDVGTAAPKATVALHEVRLIAGNSSGAVQAAGDSASTAVFDPVLVNQKALAQVLRRAGPIAAASGGNSAAAGSKNGMPAWSKASLASVDSAKDLQGLMKITMMGLKTIMWCVCNYDSNFKRRQAGGEASIEAGQESSGTVAYILSEEERLIVSNYFRWGLTCMSIYVRGLELSPPSATEAVVEASTCDDKVKTAAESKDMLECFASSFTVIEAHNFRSTVGRQVSLLSSQCQAQPSLFAIAQVFLSNPNVSPHFADVTLAHVLTGLPELVDCACPDLSTEKPSSTRASVLLHLVKLSIGFVSLFPDQEAMLARHVPNLVLTALRLVAHAKQPETLLVLLRQLFRSLSGVYGGQFEAAYDDLKPLLPHVINGLLRLRANLSAPKPRALLTELSLTVPSRVEHLLPFLPLLVPVVASALRANGELAKLGLRALEHWVDQVSPPELQNMCASEANCAELMVAVCAHLRPSPYPYGTLAIRILGKLGGRNRTFLKDVMPLPGQVAPAPFDDSSEAQAADGGSKHGQSALSLALEWEGGGCVESPSFELPLEQVALAAVQQLERLTHHAPPSLSGIALQEEHDARPMLAATVLTTKTHCLHLCTTLLSSLLELGADVTAPLSAPISSSALSSEKSQLNSDEELMTMLNSSDTNASESLTHATKSTNQLLQLLFKGLVLAAADVDLAATAEPLLDGAVVHMCTVAVNHSAISIDGSAGAAETASAQEPKSKNLSPLALNQVLVEFLCCEVGKRPDVALASMLHTVRAAHALQDGVEDWGRVIVGDLMKCVCRLFEKRDARYKRGACRAVKALCGLGSMFKSWALQFQAPLLDALLFSLKDSPREGSLLLVDQVYDTMHAVFVAIYSSDGTANDAAISSNQDALLEATQLLCRDLTWPNPAVRIGVKRALVDLALLVYHVNAEAMEDDTSSSRVGGLACVARLLAPCKESLQRSVLGKDTGVQFESLRAPQQVGLLDALTFVLSLPPVDSTDAPLSPKKAKIDSSSSSSAKGEPQVSKEEALLPINAEVLALLEESMAYSDSLPAGSEVTPGSAQHPTLALLDSFSLRGLMSRGSSSLGTGSCAALLPLLANDLCTLHAGCPTDLPVRAVQLPMALCRSLHVALVAGGGAFATGGAYASKRHSIVGTFFKLLTSPSSVEPVVEAAQQALTFVITSPTHNKDKPLPKELLQECLKPVLSQIKSHTTLTKSLLKGLARLLYLISNLFNKSLGETLLNHLGKWTEPAKIMSLQLWRPGDDVEVAAAIVGIFHLLPMSPSFLVPLVSTVVKLEATHHLFAPCAAAGDGGGFSGGPEAASPYREPLLKFLNRHKEESVFYFLRRLREPQLAHLFMHLLKHPKGGPLREQLASKQGTNLLVANAFPHALTALKSLLPTKVDQLGGATTTADGGTIAQGESSSLALSTGAPGATSGGGTVPEIPTLGREMSQVDPMDLASTPRDGGGASSGGGSTPSSSSSSTPTVPAPLTGPTGEAAASASASSSSTAVPGADTEEHAIDLEAPLSSDCDLSAPALAKACEQHLGAQVPFSEGDVEKIVYGLDLLRTLSDYDPTFVARRPPLGVLLRLLWRSPSRWQRLAHEDTLPPHLQEETRLLVCLLVSHCREKPEASVDILFELLTVFLAPSSIDYSFLKDFLRDEVAFKFPPLVKRAIGLRFLSMLKSDDVSIDPALKVLSLQLIVIPLFAATFESSRRELISVVVDDVVVKQLMASALDTSALYHYPEALRVELLRLATLLIEHLGRELVDHRKELIKFAWNHLKSEHSTSKMWAYVNVSRFISVYETPPKIILQVYVALLRAYQPESRELVQTALDVLVPSLPRRLPASEFVKAIKWTKKIMFEEGYALPVLVHIFGLIVRHPALFYAHQAQFVPQMVQFFNRLGRFPNAALENRKLAVSLVSLMLDWETHRRDRLHSGGEATAATAAAAGEATAAAAAASAENHTAPDAETTTTAVATTSAAAPAAAAENEFTLPLGMIDVVVNFLTRLALFTAEHKDPNVQHTTRRCVKLLGVALHVWPDARRSVKFSYLERVLSSQAQGLSSSSSSGDSSAADAPPQGDSSAGDEALSSSSSSSSSSSKPGLFTPSVLSTCLDLLLTMAETDTLSNFLTSSIRKVQLLLGPCFALSDDVKLQEKLKQFLTAVVTVHPPSRPPTSFVESGFYALLQDHLEKRLVLATTQSADAAAAAAPNPNDKGGNQTSGSSSSSSSTSSPSSSSSSSQGAASASSPSLANRCSAAPVVALLSKLCADSPSCLHPHVTTLVKLCHRLAREHVSATARTARALQGASGLLADLGPNGTPPRVMATPTLALLAEATCAAAAGAYTAPQSAEEDPAIATLMAALKLLGDAVSESFANSDSNGGGSSGLLESRKVFLRLVEGILMQSDHVPLLLTLVDLVSNWVVSTSSPSSSSSSPRHSPLTPKERATFLMRLAHFPRVPEPAAAPLVSKFLATVKRILSSTDAAALSGLASSGLTCVGLMASEPQTRASFQQDYLTRAGQGLASRLAHMLSSDWEALGNRYWLAATVELLLATVSQQQAPPTFVAGTTADGGSKYTPCRLPSSSSLAPSTAAPDTAMQEDTAPEGSSSATATTTTTTTAAVGAAAVQVRNQHRAFLAMMAATKASGLASSVFAPLHSLLHADVNLAHWLWQQLLPQAWSALTPSVQATLAPSLASILAKPSLRPCLGYPAPLPMMPAGGQVGRLPAGGYAHLSSAWGWSAYGSGVGVDTCGVALGGMSQGPTSPPPNVVRSMLTAMAECRPMPVLQPALLTALSSQHYAWYAGAAILEHQTLVAATPTDRLEWVRCLAKLYDELGEHDRLRALQQRSSAARETHVALSLETYGHSAEAQSLLLELMAQEEETSSAAAGGGSGSSSTSGGVGLKLSGFELELWESRWVSAARELGQWPVLEDLSKATNRPECALESAAKNNDWVAVRDQLRTPSCIAGLELGSPQHKLFEIYVAIVDGKFSDVEHHCNQCIQLALHQWATMPPLTTGDGAHVGLLRLFHQLVEVHESGQIMLEVSQQARPNSSNTPSNASNNTASTSTPDFSHIIDTWRKRLPNEWESLPEWDDLLSWRRWVFTATADAFARSAPPLLIDAGAIASSNKPNTKSSSSDGSNLLRLHDLPWTLLTRAHAARKLNLGSVALETLAALYDTPTLDVADAYTKLREQILMCLPPAVSIKGGFDLHAKNSSSADGGAAEVVHSAAKLQKLKGGLTLVNNTNLEFFNDSQRSELFRLKGVFLHLLGQSELANHAYASAATVCSQHGNNWLSWGEYCDSLYQVSGDNAHLEQSVGCYAMALQAGNTTSSATNGAAAGGAAQPLVVARLLRAMRYKSTSSPSSISASSADSTAIADDTTKGDTNFNLEAHTKFLPASMWLAWIPFLLSSLQNSHEGEANTAANFLAKVGQKYPQALYYPLRTFLLEQEAKAAGSAVVQAEGTAAAAASMEVDGLGPTDSSSPSSSALKHASALMSMLRRYHGELVQALDELCHALEARGATGKDQYGDASSSLLVALDASLQNCYANTHVLDSEPLPAEVALEIVSIYEQFVNGHTLSVLKVAFEKDFSISGGAVSGDSGTFGETVQRLNKWRHTIKSRVMSRPRQMPLAQVAPGLASLRRDAAAAYSSYSSPSTTTTSAATTTAAVTAVEVPGQYRRYRTTSSSSPAPRPHLHATLLRFGSTIEIKYSPGKGMIKRLGMLGSDGKMTYWRLDATNDSGVATKRDHLMAHFTDVANGIWSAHPQTRRRHLSFHASEVISISPHLRLVEDHPANTTLAEVYEEYCEASTSSSNAPITSYRSKLASAARAAAPLAATADGVAGADASTPAVSTSSPAQQQQQQLEAYTSACSQVPDDVLIRWVHHQVKSDPESLWALKKTLALQLSCSSLVGYALSVGQRQPHTFGFATHSGQCMSSDFHPCYKPESAVIDANEEVPFRLTRNVMTFLSPLLVDGVLASGMASAGLALSDQASNLKPFLELLLHDDVVAWQQTSSSATGASAASDASGEEDPMKGRSSHNAQVVLDRLEAVAPRAHYSPTSITPMPTTAVGASSNPTGGRVQRDQRVDHQVHRLIEAAAQPERLCQMNPTWMPWL